MAKYDKTASSLKLTLTLTVNDCMHIQETYAYCCANKLML